LQWPNINSVKLINANKTLLETSNKLFIIPMIILRKKAIK
jgi:hypothetical protein